MAHKLRLGLAAGLALAVLGFLTIRAYEGLLQLWLDPPRLAWGYIGLAVGFQVTGMAIAAQVWHRILAHLGIQSTYSFDFRVFVLSAIARKLPGTAWYAVGRIVLYHRAGFVRQKIVRGLFWELVALTLAGLLSFGFGLLAGIDRSVSGLSWLPHIPLAEIAWAVSGIMALGLGLVLLGRSHRSLIPWLNRPGTDNRPSWGILLSWTVGEMIVIGCATGVVFALLKALDPSIANGLFVPLMAAFGLSIALGPLLVWLPADLGLKDGVVYLVLSQAISPPMAALLVLVWRITVTGIELLVGGAAGVSLSPWRKASNLKG